MLSSLEQDTSVTLTELRSKQTINLVLIIGIVLETDRMIIKES